MKIISSPMDEAVFLGTAKSDEIESYLDGLERELTPNEIKILIRNICDQITNIRRGLIFAQAHSATQQPSKS